MSSGEITIFALSSGRPPAAIAVVRISGPRAGEAIKRLVGRLPEPRRATLAKLRNGGGEVLDEALVLWFPAPRSETGEDMAELQLHGGRAVIAGVLSELGSIEGLRPAEAGEFARRAFLNGRLDLTAVEGLSDLIFADTEAQRRQAYRQLKGTLASKVDHWRDRLIEAMALVEAGIDFSDEADVPEQVLAPALAIARRLRGEIASALADDRRGERLRDGLVVAIAGPPNAGKSSLLNRVARRDAAIVSPYAGTTRDVIEVHLDLEGYPVTLLDTAGIRESLDPIELEGVRRALDRASAADLVLWVVDSRASDQDTPSLEGGEGPRWLVRNKIDLLSTGALGATAAIAGSMRDFAVSALNGSGLDGLLTALTEFGRSHFDQAEPALVTRQRHRTALAEAVQALDRANAEGTAGREDVIAEELRLAARALGRLTGRVDVEDVLDVIFRDFCIGK